MGFYEIMHSRIGKKGDWSVIKSSGYSQANGIGNKNLLTSQVIVRSNLNLLI